MPYFWEENSGPRFHGHLKLGEAQSEGYDVHATYPKNGSLPHISVYEYSSTGGKVERNLYFRLSNGTVGLSSIDRQTLLSWSGVSEFVADAFVKAAYNKHIELNPPVSRVRTSRVSAPIDDDFPSLPSRPKPPLVISTPVATTPMMNSREDVLLSQLPDNVRSVVLASGAFD
jgi:hypothetical protein